MRSRSKKCCLLFLSFICCVQIYEMLTAVFPFSSDGDGSAWSWKQQRQEGGEMPSGIFDDWSNWSSWRFPGVNYYAWDANYSYFDAEFGAFREHGDYELSLFEEAFSVVDAQLFNRTLTVLTTALSRANVTFFMNGGTLLGSYRHHGRIPWDNDADLIVKAGHRRRALRAVRRCCGSDFALWKHDSKDRHIHVKFFPTAGHEVYGERYRKPYFDVFWYAKNATHIWNESPWFPGDWYLRSDVFPLRRRPFGNLMLPAPCDTASALAVYYNTSECRPIDSTVVRLCSELHDLHPFVTRSRWKASSGRMMVNETLVVGNRTLHEVTLRDGCDFQRRKHS